MPSKTPLVRETRSSLLRLKAHAQKAQKIALFNLPSFNVTKLPSPKSSSKIAVVSRKAFPGNVVRSSVTSQNTPHSTESSAGGKQKSSSSLYHGKVRTPGTTSHPISVSATIKKQSSTRILPDDNTGPRGVRATRSSSLRSPASSEKKVQRDSMSSRGSDRRSVTVSPLARAAEPITSVRSSTSALITTENTSETEADTQPPSPSEAPVPHSPPISLSFDISHLAPLTFSPLAQLQNDSTPPTPTTFPVCAKCGKIIAKVLVQPEHARPSSLTMDNIPPSDDGYSDVGASTQQRPKDPSQSPSPDTRRAHSKAPSQSHDTLTYPSPTGRPVSEFFPRLLDELQELQQSGYIIQNRDYVLLLKSYHVLSQDYFRLQAEHCKQGKLVNQHGDGGCFIPVGYFDAGSTSESSFVSDQGIEPDHAMHTPKASQHDLSDSTGDSIQIPEVVQLLKDYNALRHVYMRLLAEHRKRGNRLASMVTAYASPLLEPAEVAGAEAQTCIAELETALREQHAVVNELELQTERAQAQYGEILFEMDPKIQDQNSNLADYQASTLKIQRARAEHIALVAEVNELKAQAALQHEETMLNVGICFSKIQTQNQQLAEYRASISEMHALGAELNGLKLTVKPQKGGYEEMPSDMNSRREDQSRKVTKYAAPISEMQPATENKSAPVADDIVLEEQQKMRSPEDQNQQLAEYKAALISMMQLALAKKDALVAEANDVKLRVKLQKNGYDDMPFDMNPSRAEQSHRVTKYAALISRVNSAIEEKSALVVAELEEMLAKYEASISKKQLALSRKDALVAEANDLKLQGTLQKDGHEDMLSDMNSMIQDQNHQVTKYEAPDSEMQPAIEEKNAPVTEGDTLELSLDIAVDNQHQTLAGIEALNSEVQLTRAQKNALVAELDDLKLQGTLQKDEYDDMPSDMNSMIPDQNHQVTKYEAPESEMQPAIEDESAPVAGVATSELSLDIAMKEQHQTLAGNEASSSEMQLAQGEKHAVVAELDDLKLQGTLQKDGHEDMLSKMNSMIQDQNHQVTKYEAPDSDMQPAIEEKNAPVTEGDTLELSLDTAGEKQHQTLAGIEALNSEMQLAQSEKHAVVAELDDLKLQGTLQKDGHDAATLHVPIADDDQLQQVGWWNIYSNALGQIHPFL
ncbi:hypothetical protein DFS34DRAFT_648527 [Phlyctochytrium arcticum]|nr:hypothetical protein DFS34DRAFT_648527 [Phlyctochytrium arcticum]